MKALAYLANEFPSSLEPYVGAEVAALRQAGFRVLACTARPPQVQACSGLAKGNFLCLQDFHPRLALKAIWLAIRSLRRLSPTYRRILCQGDESLLQRGKALLHTALGFYLAAALQEQKIEHIHVHHGYFSAWIAMIAAQAIGISFSMTLHGSDVLLRAAYLDWKLQHCQFCLTISEFNRSYMVGHFPQIRPENILVQRLGVPLSPFPWRAPLDSPKPVLLTVGRLHPVKEHAFLLRGCDELRRRGVAFSCRIAGDGPERKHLEKCIAELDLALHVQLLGHLSPEQLAEEYRLASLVVLTSRSEGIPVVLMEAMAAGRPVLAPRITGIPELVLHGVTGFLYQPGSIDDFVAQTISILQSPTLTAVTNAAIQHVRRHFDRDTNLAALVDLFQRRLKPAEEPSDNANPVLQQVQLSIQRN